MTDVPEPEDLYDDFEPEGEVSDTLSFAFEDELTAALHKGINGTSQPEQQGEDPDLSPRAVNETGRVVDEDEDDSALDDSELEEILVSILDDSQNQFAPARPPHSIAQQAASLVAQQGSLASTANVFKSGAALVNRRTVDPQDNSLDEMYTSAALLENERLVKSMALACGRAASEKEAGVLAAASVTLLLQDYPAVYRGLWPAIPSLCIGADVLARFLYRSVSLRPLVSSLPMLLRRVIDRLAHELATGRPISSQFTASILAKNTRAWLAAQTDQQPTRRQSKVHPRSIRARHSRQGED
jgi:hypothetical protein